MNSDISFSQFISIASIYEQNAAREVSESCAKNTIRLPGPSNLYCARCGLYFHDINLFRAHFKDIVHDTRVGVADIEKTSVAIDGGRVLLKIDGKIYGIWKCLAFDKVTLRSSNELDVIKRLCYLRQQYIFIVLFRSGHFAAGIYTLEGHEICHKTIKKYTVRQKQGKSQSSMGGSSSFHSAGSFLRAQNERTLKDDIQGIFAAWTPLIKNVGAFVWNPTPSGYGAIFDGKSPIISLKERFLEIPFSVSDPNYSELDRVKQKLFAVSVCSSAVESDQG